MQVKLPTAHVARTRVQQVKVAEINVGTVEIERVTLRDAHMDTSTGKATLHDVRLDLTMVYSLDWRVGLTIDAPWPMPDFDISDSGTLNLGTLELGVGLGDIEVPGLASLSLDIPSLPVDDISAVVGAIRNLDLGTVLAEQIKAQNIATPRSGFDLDGLGLGGVRVNGVTVPDARMSAASVGRVSGGALPIDEIRIPNISVRHASLPTIVSKAVDARSQPIETSLPKADIGLLAAQLKVSTTARLRVDELSIANVQASGSVGEMTLQNLVVPFEVLGITLSGIDLTTLDVPQLEVN